MQKNDLKDVKAVIFDMDGVLFDTERIYLEEWIEIFNEYNYKMTKEIYLPLMGRGRKVIKEIFKKEFGDNIPIEEMYIKKDKMLFEAVDKGIPLKKGALELINILKENGFKIALATSAKKERQQKQIQSSLLCNKFDAIVCGDDVIKSKPDPEIFKKAADKLKVPYENCIVIEDSKAGIIAASKAKMIGFHVEDLLSCDEEIRKYCMEYFLNLEEILSFIKSNCLV